jgi:hypothetical protein
MNRRFFTSSLLVPSLCPLTLAAADSKPRATRSQLVRPGEALIHDAFDAGQLHEKWAGAGERTKVGVEFRDGCAVLSQAGDGQGILSQDFAAPVENAMVDVLVKPFACRWITLGFLVADETRPFKRLINLVLNENGACALHDIEARESLKTVNTRLKSDEWRRVTFEAKGEKVLVQINGKEVLDLKTPLIVPAKTGFAFTLYGARLWWTTCLFPPR